MERPLGCSGHRTLASMRWTERVRRVTWRIGGDVEGVGTPIRTPPFIHCPHTLVVQLIDAKSQRARHPKGLPHPDRSSTRAAHHASLPRRGIEGERASVRRKKVCYRKPRDAPKFTPNSVDKVVLMTAVASPQVSPSNFECFSRHLVFSTCSGREMTVARDIKFSRPARRR